MVDWMTPANPETPIFPLFVYKELPLDPVLEPDTIPDVLKSVTAP